MQINIRQFKKWIAALDSGKYKQVKHQMQSKTGFCVLGVGCKVTIPPNKQRLDNIGRLMGGGPYSQPYAPEWLKNINLDFSDKTDESLIWLNDWRDYTFPEIATLLELVYIHKILD